MVDAMYKMILKQLWNERKGNLFIWLEMLVVSIFLWYAADALFVMYRLYSQPLGFNIEHTYHVSFGVIPEESPDYDTTSVHSERGGGDYLTLMDRIRGTPPWNQSVSPPACIFITGDRINTPRSGRTR